MRTRIYQVDAFTSRLFRGNPAAVCPLDGWLDDARLQAVAAENNLSETAFLVPRDDDFELRWFTPAAEVRLCGHATLAAAHVVLRVTQASRSSVTFQTHSGALEVVRRGERLAMDFPARPSEPSAAPEGLVEGLGATPEEVRASDDWMAVFGSEGDVAGLEPDFRRLAGLGRRGVIATAPSDGPADFVSRFFAPSLGIDEDPVTGSAHCALAPYWSARLGREKLLGRQISARGGEVACRLREGRVELEGDAVLYLEGWIVV